MLVAEGRLETAIAEMRREGPLELSYPKHPNPRGDTRRDETGPGAPRSTSTADLCDTDEETHAENALEAAITKMRREGGGK